jgi:hypothetical protein
MKRSVITKYITSSLHGRAREMDERTTSRRMGFRKCTLSNVPQSATVGQFRDFSVG